MKLYYTYTEGGKWYTWKMSRKDINEILKRFLYEATTYYNGSTFKAVRIGKSPMIYDFVLLKLRKQPWIRNLPNAKK